MGANKPAKRTAVLHCDRGDYTAPEASELIGRARFSEIGAQILESDPKKYTAADDEGTADEERDGGHG